MITLFFFAKIYFFNEVEERKHRPLDEKLKITLKFVLIDLLYEEEAIYTIETSIKEELVIFILIKILL